MPEPPKISSAITRPFFIRRTGETPPTSPAQGHSSEEQMERKMEAAAMFTSVLHELFLSFQSGLTIYKTQGICFLYYITFLKMLPIRFAREPSHFRLSIDFCLQQAEGLEIPASGPYLSVLGKSHVFLLACKVGYHTAEGGGCKDCWQSAEQTT